MDDCYTEGKAQQHKYIRSLTLFASPLQIRTPFEETVREENDPWGVHSALIVLPKSIAFSLRRSWGLPPQRSNPKNKVF